jgi:hypothetical protein
MSSTPPPQPPTAPVPPSGPLPKGPVGKTWPVGVTILLTIITCGIYGLYWQYRVFEDLKQHNGTGLGGPIALIIGIFISVVNMFILPSEIKSTYEDDGRESPVTPLYGLWFLLPLIGNIIWFVKVQHALNDYWESKGAAPPS